MHDDDKQTGVPLEPAGLTYLRGRLSDVSLGELVWAGPRAAQFLVRSASRHLRADEHRHPEIPTRATTWGTAASVFLDEVMLAFMATTRLHRNDIELDRILDETTQAIAALDRARVPDDPTRLHPEPADPMVTLRPQSYRGIRYQHLTFPSGYEPVVELPGSTRWMSIGPNRTAHAYVLTHRAPRPWIVNLHGFGMGRPSDVVALRALHFHRDLGLNVIQPVFPLHGPRAPDDSAEQTFSLDYLNNVHSLCQAVSDTRSAMAWARSDHGASSFTLHGVSMGGYTAALVAGVSDDIDCVIAGVPTVDMAWVLRRHIPEPDRVPLDSRGLLGPMVEKVHAPVSPLAFEPRVPVDRRFVYAGVADRMATPGQAHRLWMHWDQPPVLWYRGSHVSFAWSREVRRFVDRAVRLGTGVGIRAEGSRP